MFNFFEFEKRYVYKLCGDRENFTLLEIKQTTSIYIYIYTQRYKNEIILLQPNNETGMLKFTFFSL